ncbi:hypothetical protein ACTMU2_07770 [Cupriavidus basilensis]
MNDYKPQPIALYFGIVIGVIVAGLMLAAFANGPEMGWTGCYKLVAVELGPILSRSSAVDLHSVFEGRSCSGLLPLKAMRWIAFYDKTKRTPDGVEPTAEIRKREARSQGRALRDALRLGAWPAVALSTAVAAAHPVTTT